MFISKTAKIVVNNGEYYLNVGSKQEKISEEQLNVFIDNYLNNKKLNENLKPFIDSSFIINNPQNYAENIYYKSLLYENVITNYKIDKSKKILILGCGGIGNFILYALASHGFMNFILVDEDIIEESNLNRQFLFEREDIGKYKTEILKNRIEKKFNNVNIEIVNQMINSDALEQFKDVEFMILSADSDDCLRSVNNFSLEYKIPYLPVGYLNDISVIGPLVIPNITSCHECALIGCDIDNYADDTITKTIDKINNRYEAPSAFANNAIATSMAINDILLFCANDFVQIKSLNKRVGINNLTFEKYEIPIVKNERCKCKNF